MPKNNINADLKERVLQYIQLNHLINPSRKVLVAVSGGPDSVCLLHVLHQLREVLGIRLHVAHLNHQLRGEESDRDAEYVSDLAKKLDIPTTVERGDVTGYQDDHRLSLEEAAREVRYSFLARVAGAVDADRAAVGHTRDDQVETILLHIIRGTGTRGLRGLQSSQTLRFSGSGLRVIRPLLEITREETEEYCSLFELKPRFDSSNLSLSMLRNRVRRELLPLLRSYNPEISRSILRISSIAQDDLAFLEAGSVEAWQQIIQKDGNNYIFDKKGFKTLAPAIQRQLLRTAIDKLLGTLKDIETRHIEEILEALDKPSGKQITLPGDLVFTLEHDRYLLSFISQETNPFPVLGGEYKIRIPGQTDIPGWTLMVEIQAADTPINSKEFDNDVWTAKLDRKSVGDTVILRNRRRGDSFQPLGMNHTKKVAEFMLDARIPRRWRERIPVLLTPKQLIWIAGYRIDERVRVTSRTKQVVCLRLIKKPDILPER
jgi:tRNA(Ile)-lysidine synthase